MILSIFEFMLIIASVQLLAILISGLFTRK